MAQIIRAGWEMFKRLFVLVLVGTFVPLLYVDVNIGEHIIYRLRCSHNTKLWVLWVAWPQPLVTVMLPRANNE